MKRLRRLILLPLIALVTAAVLIACAGGGNTATIRVASKGFTESYILGEMYTLALENAGFQVDYKPGLGTTDVIQTALQNGEVDLYPEYTGTALLTVLKLEANSDQQQVYETVAKEYASQFNLVWLEAAPMNNTQALAMTQEGSTKFGITTISQLVPKASELTMVGPPEFREREDGLPGIKAAYGDFELKQYIEVDPGLRYSALREGQADIAVAFGTDGEISAFNLVVLEDDKNLFPPYQVAPVVRQEVLDANPTLAEVLNAISPKLTTETMQRLNFEVDGKQREPVDVAREFLEQEGLLSE